MNVSLANKMLHPESNSSVLFLAQAWLFYLISRLFSIESFSSLSVNFALVSQSWTFCPFFKNIEAFQSATWLYYLVIDCHRKRRPRAPCIQIWLVWSQYGKLWLWCDLERDKCPGSIYDNWVITVQSNQIWAQRGARLGPNCTNPGIFFSDHRAKM